MAGSAFAALAAVCIGVHAAHALLGFGPDRLVADWLYCAVFVLTAASCVLRARRSPAHLQQPWVVAAIGVLVWGAAEVTYRLLEPDPAHYYPAASQALLFVGFGLATFALMRLARERVERIERTLALDGLIGGLAVAAIAAMFLFPPGVHPASDQQAPSAIFLMGDLLSLTLVVVIVALTGWRPGACWAAFTGAIVLNTIGNVALVHASAAGTFHRGSVVDTLFAASAAGLGIAAWHPVRPKRGLVAAGTRALWVPSGFATVALLILAVGTLRPVGPVAGALAALTVALLIVRTVVAVRAHASLIAETRREALTDGLTGLGNRRKLGEDLETAAHAAGNGRPVTLVLYDLDGFKHYNDAFGHPAGDVLLARLARRFRIALGDGCSYRMGGDEFCALLPGTPDDVAPAIAAAAAALSDAGDGFSVSSSFGAVGLPREATSPPEALQLADRRMYGHKDGRRASAAHQSRAVLVQALHEREPGLGVHHAEVAELAVAVAREMGFPAFELRDIARAAELHDIGKMAIPDAILHKPGPLDADERSFVRRHTEIGERILAAAPGLVPASRLVRASHERWDGTGYPDGLAGEAIPLGARIIAVCDSFAAMTEDRPYSTALGRRRAVVELRRCAGTQFDPRVVEVFVAVSERHPETPVTPLRAVS